MKKITLNQISEFENYLKTEEKSNLTCQKYIRDVKAFYHWLSGHNADKFTVLSYKEYISQNYASASVNSMLSSINTFFDFCGRHDLRVKHLKIQRQIFAEKDKELSKDEYKQLLKAAKSNKRLYLLMQTICSCGLRVSELKFITIDAIKKHEAEIRCKCKIRRVLLPDNLCRMLLSYATKQGIRHGSIFITKSGKPLNRSNIWTEMKKLSALSNVPESKIFPHNLRHLFARTYYSVQKDIVRLADILGHSNINTTRIYTSETGDVHRRQIQKLGLVLTHL